MLFSYTAPEVPAIAMGNILIAAIFGIIVPLFLVVAALIWTISLQRNGKTRLDQGVLSPVILGCIGVALFLFIWTF